MENYTELAKVCFSIYATMFIVALYGNKCSLHAAVSIDDVLSGVKCICHTLSNLYRDPFSLCVPQ